MEQKPEVKHLQENLSLLRKSIGWSAEELGNRIGVSRQSINNFESNRSELTQAQYMAIRVVFNEEIDSRPKDETHLLQKLLIICVDQYDNFNKEDRKAILTNANIYASAVSSKGTTIKDANIEWRRVLAASANSAICFAAGVLAKMAYDKYAWTKSINNNLGGKSK